MPEQLIIGFNPMAAANKVAYLGSQIRSRLIWLGVSIVLCIVIWRWQAEVVSGEVIGWLFGIGIAYSLIYLLIGIFNWQRAKSALAAISPGVAATVDRQGIWMQGTGMAWPQIAKVAITPGRFGGSPNLVVRRVDGPAVDISLALLDALPGTIDTAVRAYSGGAQSLDTSKLGN